jgi:Flp pilus assembly protein TadG
MVEFALVAPIFFLLLFGMLEASRFVFYYEILNNATREGARYAIVNGRNSLRGEETGPRVDGTCADSPCGSRVVAKVRSSAFGVLGSAVAVTPTWDPDNGRGSTVTVAATYTYSTLVPLVPLPPITVSAESSLVINN